MNMHFNHRKSIALLLVLILCLSACSSQADMPSEATTTNTTPQNSIQPFQTQEETAEPDETAAVQYPWDNNVLYKVNRIKDSTNMHEAMRHVEEFLRHAPVSYQWIVRDFYYSDGEKLPALWLFGISERGECIDVVMMETDPETLENIVVPDLMNDGVVFYRKNEIKSYRNLHGFPLTLHGSNVRTFSSTNENFSILYGGENFAMHDLNSRFLAQTFWNGEWIEAGPRPTAEPIYADTSKPGYATYAPAQSMEEELEAIKNRLESTGLGYEWEILDSIEINKTSYPVQWLYAVNDNEEWVDIVLSEDPDFCYLMNEHRNILWELRQEQRDKYNALHPGRAEAAKQIGEAFQGNSNSWVLQDVFYHGYSYFMEGHGLALQDCGSPCTMQEWNDELQYFVSHYSRDAILNINVFPNQFP